MASDPYRVQLLSVGQRVAERRRAYGLTQEALAEKMAKSTKYLQRVERGNENLTLKSLLKIADVLDITLSYLVRPMKPKPRKPGRPRKRPVKRAKGPSG